MWHVFRRISHKWHIGVWILHSPACIEECYSVGCVHSSTYNASKGCGITQLLSRSHHQVPFYLQWKAEKHFDQIVRQKKCRVRLAHLFRRDACWVAGQGKPRDRELSPYWFLRSRVSPWRIYFDIHMITAHWNRFALEGYANLTTTAQALHTERSVLCDNGQKGDVRQSCHHPGCNPLPLTSLVQQTLTKLTLSTGPYL